MEFIFVKNFETPILAHENEENHEIQEIQEKNE